MDSIAKKIDTMSEHIKKTKANECGHSEQEVERTVAFYRGQRWALASLLYELNGCTGLTAMELCEASLVRVGIEGS